MSSIADTAVVIQSSEQSVPSTPSWFGEGTLIAHYLKRLGVLSAIEERVRFARRRFGHYELIDFVAVLLAYAISGEARQGLKLFIGKAGCIHCHNTPLFSDNDFHVIGLHIDTALSPLSTIATI